jgi:hypothetical protein
MEFVFIESRSTVPILKHGSQRLQLLAWPTSRFCKRWRLPTVPKLESRNWSRMSVMIACHEYFSCGLEMSQPVDYYYILHLSCYYLKYNINLIRHLKLPLRRVCTKKLQQSAQWLSVSGRPNGLTHFREISCCRVVLTFVDIPIFFC